MEDKNQKAYEERRKDANWLSNHLGQYVGFVDGSMVVSGSKNHVLNELRRRFPDKQKFFAYVTEQEEIIDVPSALEVF